MHETAFQMARRASLRATHAWLAIVAASTDIDGALDEVWAELQAHLGEPLRHVRVDHRNPENVRQELVSDPEDCVLLSHLDEWREVDWRDVDANRSAWERVGVFVWLLTPVSADAIGQYAPNLRSYMGAYHFIAREDTGMSDAEVQNRLAELRAEYSLSDARIIDMAEQKTLSPGAHFVEWLILLNRGDLV